MTRRRWERVLWAAALAVALGGWLRWRDAVPRVRPVPAGVAGAPGDPPRPAPGRLAAAARSVAAANPFRLDRVPAPVGYSRPLAGPMGMGTMPPPPTYTPPPPPRPALAVTGIVGPPWQALLEGVPGREGAVAVRAGTVLGDLRVRSVTRDRVVVAGADTSWTLSVRKPWQQ
ncbi:MAG TPA: hypothetical protein VGB24_20710 [Longimicrobium sp.]|jgi:hypothetical protein|uniref:hypothetical protein n=1 Tax=Longimicrobium sp. TaxID=2029185 RepID=UPI002ED7E19B